MRSYKEVFEEAQSKASTYDDFNAVVRDWQNFPDLFHFIMANNVLLAPDEDSLNLARAINSVFTNFMLEKGPLRHTTLDSVEARHILMLTFIEKCIGSMWGNVLEIGGGYGNFIRLVDGYVNYTHWNIVDLPYIIALQKYLLSEQELADNIDFIPAMDAQVLSSTPFDVVIGTHSLSEFDKDTFDEYLEGISKSKRLFYATHQSEPSIELVEYKYNSISKIYAKSDFLIYEGGNSIIYYFKKKE